MTLALRQLGCKASILMIGEESHPPYQRPPLSKSFLQGDIEASSIYLRRLAAYAGADIDLRLNTRVERIDAHSRTLTLSDGKGYRYGKLALATGGRARRLPIDGSERAGRAENFCYLRTIEDAVRIRNRFHPGQHLVVIGGGYIGLEVAAAAVSYGLKVTVLEALTRVLARVTAVDMSLFYERIHREAGVDLRTDVGVIGFEFSASGDEVTAVHCRDGSVVASDLVVAGVGLLPNAELAESAGLRVDDGVIVDELAQTSDPHIVAAGDCANHPDKVSGRRVRLESVPNAVEQARAAAATLLGKHRPYTALPWFWSNQYDLKLQMAGLSQGHDQVIVRGSMANRSFAAFYLRNRQIIACDAVNRPQEFMIARRLIASCIVADPALLADDGAPLKALAASS